MRVLVTNNLRSPQCATCFHFIQSLLVYSVLSMCNGIVLYHHITPFTKHGVSVVSPIKPWQICCNAQIVPVVAWWTIWWPRLLKELPSQNFGQAGLKRNSILYHRFEKKKMIKSTYFIHFLNFPILKDDAADNWK